MDNDGYSEIFCIKMDQKEIFGITDFLIYLGKNIGRSTKNRRGLEKHIDDLWKKLTERARKTYFI